MQDLWQDLYWKHNYIFQKAFQLTTTSKEYSMNSYSKGQRGIAGEHLYSHFLEAGHKGIVDMRVKIIDKTNVNDPTNREGF